MPQYWGNKYFINYILEYINVEVASCHSNRGNKYFYNVFQNILMYKWFHATVLGELNIFISYILECINVEVVSCHSNRENKYFYKIYFRIY